MKNKLKFVSLFLAITMVLTVMPVNIFAATAELASSRVTISNTNPGNKFEPEPDSVPEPAGVVPQSFKTPAAKNAKITVDKVDVTLPHFPKVGLKPDLEVSVSSDAYELNASRPIVWIDMTEGTNFITTAQINSGYKFEADHKYVAECAFQLKDTSTYCWGDSDDIEATLNNKLPSDALYKVARKQFGLTDTNLLVVDFEFPKLGGTVSDPEESIKTINTVEIDNLDIPKYDQHPDFYVSIPSDARYHLASAEELDAAGILADDYTYGISWNYYKQSGTSQSMIPSDSFSDSSGSYSCNTVLIAEEGYHFGDSLSIKVNGEDKSGLPLSETVLKIVAVDKAKVSKPDNFIDLVEINDFKLPEYGKKPNFKVTVPSDAHYYVTNGSEIDWVDCTTGESMLDSDVFDNDASENYFAEIMLKPKYGYHFAKNITFKINGATDYVDTHYSKSYGNSASIITTYFTVNDGKKIKDVNIKGFTNPEYDKHPDFDLNVPVNVHYHIASKEELENLGYSQIDDRINGVLWADIENNKCLNAEDRYLNQKANNYFAQIVLIPDDGYEFDDEVVVSINSLQNLVDTTRTDIKSSDMNVFSVYFDVLEPNHEHSYHWVIDEEPTAEKEGSKHLECSVCGHKQAPVSIPKLKKTYVLEMPVVLNVKQLGELVPDKETFKFEAYLKDYDDDEEPILVKLTDEIDFVTDSITIENLKFKDNKSTVPGTLKLKITGSDNFAKLSDGFVIKMVKGNSDGWTYAKEEWVVYPYCAYRMALNATEDETEELKTIYADYYLNVEEETPEASTMTFNVSYNKNKNKPKPEPSNPSKPETPKQQIVDTSTKGEPSVRNFCSMIVIIGAAVVISLNKNKKANIK